MSNETSSIRTQIDRVNASFAAAFRRGDSTGATAVYSDAAQILPPNLPMMSGKQAIQSFWQGAMEMGVAEVVLETVEFEAHGDRAWEVGKGVLKTKDGRVIDEAKYIVIWKREHGAWEWHRDIWNSSHVAQA